MRIGFVMEQALGHATHHKNLASRVVLEPDIEPIWMPVAERVDDNWEKMPVVRGNWSLKASLRARDALRSTFASGRPDALFVHTQTTALFAIPYMNQVPTVLSLDATPINYDAVGAAYGHYVGSNKWLEGRKFAWNRSTFRAARAIVTWCQWAKDSLIADYGIPADMISVIPPGVDMEQWRFHRTLDSSTSKPTRLLFVGGDFKRKGGEYLAEAFKTLTNSCELDVVTKEHGVECLFEGSAARIHRGLTANSEPLRALFAQADIFVFPTLADCLPIAVMEAMAAGLPVITTNVGAMNEEVEPGVNGLLVVPNSAAEIVKAVQELRGDRARMREMGIAGRAMAEERFDLHRNYGALLSLLKTAASTENRKNAA